MYTSEPNLKLNKKEKEILDKATFNAILLCVSGGADSMYLLHAMINYYHKLSLSGIVVPDIHIGHVNHGISQYSNEWEKNVYAAYISVKQYYPNLNFYFASTSLNLKNTAQSNSDLTETACRNARYKWIYDYCFKNNIDCIFTGHHFNDDMEHKLISVFRNRIHEIKLPFLNTVNEINIGQISKCKPLLNLTKQEITNWCIENNIAFVHDESNDKSDCLRNIFRNDLFKNIQKLSEKENNDNYYLKSMEAFFQHYEKVNQFYQEQVNQKALLGLSNKKIKNDKEIRYSLNCHELQSDFIADVIAQMYRLHYLNEDKNVSLTNEKRLWLSNKIDNHLKLNSQGIIQLLENVKVNFMYDNGVPNLFLSISH